MQPDLSDNNLRAKLKAELDRRVEDVDAVTAARLSAARARAVDAVSTSRRRMIWAPVAGAMATGLLVAVISVWSPRDGHDVGLALDEMELLSANEDLEFYSDLEFYEWLDDAETG